MFLVLLLTGCLFNCTLMYAPSELSIDFEPALSAVADWEVEVRDAATDQVVRCAFTLDEATGDTGDIGDTGPLPTTRACDNDPTTAAWLSVDPDTGAVTSVGLTDFSPRRAVVRLTRDGALVTEQTLRPDYAVDHPNGTGCGVRKLDRVALQLP